MKTKKLIFHVGPPKCGSTSIQDFFKINKKPCKQRVKFIMLPVQLIKDLNFDEPIGTQNFIKLFNESIKENDVIILSHEILFVLPKVVDKICMLVSKKVSEITVIGFLRRSSDQIVSLFHQSLFHNKEHQKIIDDLMLKNSINPNYFFGFEKILIGTILSLHSKKSLNYLNHILLDVNSNPINKSMKLELPFIKNSETYYNTLKKTINKYNGNVIVGVLPSKKSKKTLIQDFCDIAGLKIKPEYKKIDLISNPQYNSHLIESVNNSLVKNFETIDFINTIGFANSISEIMDNELNLNSSILYDIKQYVDFLFYQSNVRLCKTYNLDVTYFSVDKSYAHEEIISIIKKERDTRKENNFLLESYKEINENITKALFKTYQTLKKKENYIHKNNKVEKINVLKLIWHKTPEPIRKIGRKFL